jgi:hypothetical protein
MTPRHRQPRDPGGIIGPLRERIHDLTRELDSLKRVSGARINALETDNQRLKLALRAYQPEPPPAAPETPTQEQP